MRRLPTTPEFDEDVFLEDGVPIPFFPERITSGLAVGVPGTFATWVRALEDYGTISLAQACSLVGWWPRRGSWSTRPSPIRLWPTRPGSAPSPRPATCSSPDGKSRPSGTLFRNPDLARTYHLLQREGFDGFYTGELAAEIADTVQNPPTVAEPAFTVRPGLMTTADLASYDVLRPEPTMNEYRGYEVYGMGPPSSGGITVGESPQHPGQLRPRRGLRRRPSGICLLEATATAFADRNAYIGDDRPSTTTCRRPGCCPRPSPTSGPPPSTRSLASPKPVAPG